MAAGSARVLARDAPGVVVLQLPGAAVSRFVVHLAICDRGRHEFPLDEAARLGWDFPYQVGRNALGALDVGESVADQDGDTWTRVS